MKSKETKKLENQKEDTSSKKQKNDDKDIAGEQVQNGVIPENMDFKRFLGCGG
jgi:hypothetical protein